MPYSIEHRDDKWVVVTQGTDKVHGSFGSKEKAEAQMRALYANVDDAGKSAGDTVLAFGSTVKRLGGNRVGGYLILFGSPDEHDLSRDYFSQRTDYGLNGEGKGRSVVLYNHTFNAHIGDEEIGGGDLWMDDVGVAIDAEVKLGKDPKQFSADEIRAREDYEEEILKMVDAGMLGWSSGTLGHRVRREKVGKAYHIKKWPLGLDASLTSTPCDPRNIAMSLKSWAKTLQEGSDSEGGEMVPDDETAEGEKGKAADHAGYPSHAAKATHAALTHVHYDHAEKVASMLTDESHPMNDTTKQPHQRLGALSKLHAETTRRSLTVARHMMVGKRDAPDEGKSSSAYGLKDMSALGYDDTWRDGMAAAAAIQSLGEAMLWCIRDCFQGTSSYPMLPGRTPPAPLTKAQRLACIRAELDDFTSDAYAICDALLDDDEAGEMVKSALESMHPHLTNSPTHGTPPILGAPLFDPEMVVSAAKGFRDVMVKLAEQRARDPKGRTLGESKRLAITTVLDGFRPVVGDLEAVVAKFWPIDAAPADAVNDAKQGAEGEDDSTDSQSRFLALRLASLHHQTQLNAASFGVTP